jgi:hypothetical protein
MAHSATPGMLNLSAGLLTGLGIAGTSFTLVIAAFSKHEIGRNLENSECRASRPDGRGRRGRLAGLAGGRLAQRASLFSTNPHYIRVRFD